MKQCIALLFVMLTAVSVTEAKSTGVNAKAALLIDTSTRNVLYERNARKPMPVASLTKMMTAYLVFEAVADGRLRWNDRIHLNGHAHRMASDENFPVAETKEHSAGELLELMLIRSSNIAAVALAEAVSGSEQDFVVRMNRTARLFGLKNTRFINSSGLDQRIKKKRKRRVQVVSNIMSARDAAYLAMKLMKDYPEVLEVTSSPSITYEERDLGNTNWMVRKEDFHVEGMDGLKTGYTKASGFCMVGTALRDDRRLVAVVLNARSNAGRFGETKRLLEYGSAASGKRNGGNSPY